MEADDPIEGAGVVDESRPPEAFDDDAWIAEEIDRQAREQETDDGQGEGERYIAQLMDTLELRSLHTALRRTEVQLATEGRLREYTPRQSATPEAAQMPTTRHGCIWGGRDWSTDTNESNQSAHQEGNETEEAAPEAGSSMTRAELAQTLRAECYQVRELEQRYADTKRMLLDHMEMICTSKPHDRVGSPETFEQLSELMAFASQCALDYSPR